MKHRTRMIVERVGRNLADARREAGMTQQQVAERIDVKAAQYARMERGEHDTGISRYLDAAWAIGMAPRDLFRHLESRMP